jgi:hypothetical protein
MEAGSIFPRTNINLINKDVFTPLIENRDKRIIQKEGEMKNDHDLIKSEFPSQKLIWG